MSGPCDPSAGRAVNARYLPSPEHAAVPPSMTTSSAIAKGAAAVAVGEAVTVGDGLTVAVALGDAVTATLGVGEAGSADSVAGAEVAGSDGRVGVRLGASGLGEVGSSVGVSPEDTGVGTGTSTMVPASPAEPSSTTMNCWSSGDLITACGAFWRSSTRGEDGWI